MDDRSFYVIKGCPIPLARARIAKSNRMWDTQKRDKLGWGLQLHSQHEGKEPFTCPLHLDIFFYMQIPSYPAAKKKGLLPGKHHYYIPDLSNLVKFVEDAGTGVLWNDDCIISSFSAKKIYDNDPRTEFFVTKLKR